MARNEERRLELIGMIEEAFLHFAGGLFTPDGQLSQLFSMRRKMPSERTKRIPAEEVNPFEEGENDDWESAEEEGADKENEPPPTENGPELLGRTTTYSMAFRLRAIAQVHELLVTNRHATKRNLFYDSKLLYKFQSNFDRALSAVCKFLDASRSELHVVSCSKGFAIGDLHLCNAMDDCEVDFHHSTVAITEALTHFDLVQSEAAFLMVVEKDSVFQQLLDEQWVEKFPRSILLTGRGYPDICTRQFLAWLSDRLPKLPILALVDADPYGIEIFLTYKFGSERTRIESGDIQLPRLQWIGFLPSETEQLSFPEDQFLPLIPSDRRRIEKLMERVLAHGEEAIFDELSILLRNDWKLEIEAICSLGHQFLTAHYLAYKLQPFYAPSAPPSIAAPFHDFDDFND